MPSLWDTLSDVAADGTAVHWDAPGGLYDRLFQGIQKSDMLPKGKTGCLALIAGAFAAHSFLKQKLGNGPGSNFVNSVLGSTVRQTARRTLDALDAGHAEASSSSVGTPAPPPPTRGRDALFEVSADVRIKILRHFEHLDDEQRPVFKDITRHCNPAELAAIAEMPSEEVQTLLSFLAKQSLTTVVSDIVSPLSASITAGMNELAARLNKLAGEKE